MKPLILLAAMIALPAIALQAQKINHVLDGASYTPNIAQGSLVVVDGSGLAPAGLSQYAPEQGQPVTLPASWNGVSILFTPVGGGAAVTTYMLFTFNENGGELVAGVLPSTTATGDYNVTVNNNGSITPAFKATVVARKFGIITANSGGTGPSQSQIYTPAGGLLINRFTRYSLAGYEFGPSSPGDTIVLWGTGLGPIAKADNIAPGFLDLKDQANVKVLLGGKEITPAYAGRAPEFPGADQVNFVVPADAQTGCTIPLQVKVGSVLSNRSSVAILAAGQNACQNPFLSQSDLASLDQGGSVSVGAFGLSAQTTQVSFGGTSVETRNEVVSGGFYKYTAANIDALGDYDPSQSAAGIGTCRVVRQNSFDTTENTAQLSVLDAGNPLKLDGPNAAGISVDQQVDKTYSKVLASVIAGIPGIPGIPGAPSPTPVIAQGTYTLTGTGGLNIGAFTASTPVPALLDWTNRSTISMVNRSSPLQLNWTGGGASDLVTITGISANLVGGTENAPVFDSGVFVCIARASAGTFSVPANILSQLPATTGSVENGASLGSLALALTGDGSTGRFQAPVVGDGQTKLGIFQFSDVDSKSVTYQ